MSLEVEDRPSVEPTKQLKRQDSLYGDAEKVSSAKYHGSEGSWSRLLQLAFQSVGIIYGDVGTSPLYAISSTFPDGIKNRDDLLGVLSLILYTLILIPMVKYVFIVLYADDHGDGGTFALYSLISRHAKIRLIPNQQAEDAMVSNYGIEAPSRQLRRAQWLKQKLESSMAAKISLFTITILGTSMVMGDGTLTPAISKIQEGKNDGFHMLWSSELKLYTFAGGRVEGRGGHRRYGGHPFGQGVDLRHCCHRPGRPCCWIPWPETFVLCYYCKKCSVALQPDDTK